MDLGKLNSNEKMAALGAVLAIVGSLVSFGAGPYGVLTGLAMLLIIFLPQFSPTTNLPGSKGSLMVVVGGAAGIGAVLTLLAWLPYLGHHGRLLHRRTAGHRRRTADGMGRLAGVPGRRRQVPARRCSIDGPAARVDRHAGGRRRSAGAAPGCR